MSPSASGSSSAVLPEHCFYCFEVIQRHLERQRSKGGAAAGGDVEDEVEATFPDETTKYPLFVTWDIYSSPSALSRAAQPLTNGTANGHGSSSRLRGCIGTFEPRPLKEGLAEYAQIAAFEDRRFSPISLAELPRLECTISLLTAFEDCTDYLDWEIGTHGIYIHLTPPESSLSTFSRRSRTLTATYLPDVAPAQGWSKEEAIESAIRKSGYEGKITQELKDTALKVRKYRSEKISRTFEDWKSWRESHR